MRSLERVLLLLVLAGLCAGCADGRPGAVQSRLVGAADGGGAQLSPVRGLSGGAAIDGFERAVAPRAFRFPDDLGAHPTFKLEWWYYSGNLQAADGRRFGYQFTIFRQGLRPPRPAAQDQSAWRAGDAYLAHFAISDAAGGQHREAVRLSRGGAIGLAGAQAQPFRVWLEDWQAAGDAQRMAVRAADPEQAMAVDLQLEALKPPVLQGEQGLSRKSAGVGNASYYFSLPRMRTQGTLTLDGKRVAVSGQSWMDREWSTSVLDAGQVGWDWFALQLDSGDELMWGQLRRADGQIDPFSLGALIDQRGGVTHFRREELELRVLETWRSPQTGGVYPVRWQMRVPARGIDVEIRALIPDQEMRAGFRYWEGAVDVGGSLAGRPVSGSGYVEMTGYAENPAATP